MSEGRQEVISKGQKPNLVILLSLDSIEMVSQPAVGVIPLGTGELVCLDGEEIN